MDGLNMLAKRKVRYKVLSSWLIGLFAATLTWNVYALGLSEIVLHSALNEPLDATIEVIDIEGLNENQMLFQMGNQVDFDRAKVERLLLLDRVEFELEIISSTTAKLHLSTSFRVVEPYLNFVVSSSWPTGRLLREYTVLMDLPTFSQTPAPTVDVATGSVSQGALLPSSGNQISSVKSTVSEAANTSISTTTNNNRNNTGTRTTNFELSNSNDTPSNEVVIKENDSLWKIAQTARPDRSVSIQQTMLAIQTANPDAFINNNINRIKVGSVLQIPSMQEILALSQQQAITQVALQNRQIGTELLAINSVVNESEDRVVSTDELRVLTADSINTSSNSGSGGNGLQGLSGTISSLQEELALSEESLDRAQIENDELNDLMSEMETEITLLQGIIEIEDERLFALQQDLQRQAEVEIAAAASLASEMVAAKMSSSEPASSASTSLTAESDVILTEASIVQTFEEAELDTSLLGRVLAFFQNGFLLIGFSVAFISLVLGFLFWRSRRHYDDEGFQRGFEPADTNNNFDMNVFTSNTDREKSALEPVSTANLDDNIEVNDVELKEIKEISNSLYDDDFELGNIDISEFEDEFEGEFEDEFEDESENDFAIDSPKFDDAVRKSEMTVNTDSAAKIESFSEEVGGLETDIHFTEAKAFETEKSSFGAPSEVSDELLKHNDEAKLELQLEPIEKLEANITADRNDDDFGGVEEAEPNIEVSSEALGYGEELKAETSELDKNTTSNNKVESQSAELAPDATSEKSVGSVNLKPLDIEFEVRESDASAANNETESEYDDLELSSINDNLIEFPLNIEAFKVPTEYTEEDAAADIESEEFSGEFPVDYEASERSHSELGESDITRASRDEKTLGGNDQDQYATKLDLAVAYEAMGDFDGARAILQEVVAAGDEAQAGEARRLLQKRAES